MPYKDYPVNPLYQNVPDEFWTAGYCAIFAYALHERFGCSMRALVVKSTDGEETMVHTVGVLPDGRVVDADGIRPAEQFGYEDWSPEAFAELVFRPVEESRVELEDVGVDRLYELTPEDVQDTNAAHAYIDRHPELFGQLERKVQRKPQRGASLGM